MTRLGVRAVPIPDPEAGILRVAPPTERAPALVPGRTIVRHFPYCGWLGLALIALFWPLNWLLDGLRTHWAFFPLWLGYCLVVDGLNVRRTGTSLLTRNRRMYVLLFLLSVPCWWVFEALNLRTQNWHYLGREFFSDLEFAVLASLAFSTVVPAVLGTAELFASVDFVRRLRRGPILRPGPRTPPLLLAAGLAALVMVVAWPRYFYPLVWLSLYLLVEPINLWMGNRSLLEWTRVGDWRPVASLWLGILVCGFLWEMWNFLSYPKWVYAVPWLGFWHVFEMPLLGYLGYLPFSLGLFGFVHLLLGSLSRSRTNYIASAWV